MTNLIIGGSGGAANAGEDVADLPTLSVLGPQTLTAFALQGVGFSLSFTGLGFTNYDGGPLPQDGLITGYTITESGGATQTFTGLNLFITDLLDIIALGGIAADDAFNDAVFGDVDNLSGGGGADTLSGFAGDDVILGGGGADALFGGGGDDFLIGDNQNDVTGAADILNGGDGDDLMRGGAGVDTYSGGDGNDRVSFFSRVATQGVVASLVTQTIDNDGFGNAETMSSIENLGAGTAFVDNFTGDDNDNFFGAGIGDIITANDGADSFQIDGAAFIDGGDGNDTINQFIAADSGALVADGNADGLADLVFATQGVTVDLDAGSIVNDGFGNSSTIISIENVGGSVLDDTLIGSSVANVLTGYFGDDVLVGLLGADTLLGGEGDDQLVGESGFSDDSTLGGADTLDGGDGDDYLRGGAGADTFIGGDGFDRISFFGRAATAGVVANLMTQTISNDGFGNAETMTSIEGLGGGTAFADTFIGDNNFNFILAGFGDILTGNGGDDGFQIDGAATINGGAGNDTITRFNGQEFGALAPDANADGLAEVIFASAGVIVDLSLGSILDDGFGNSSAIVSIENVGGSSLDDEITGSAAANILWGYGGADQLIGGLGADTLFGGFGSVPDNTGDGVDTLDGGAGNDVLFGGLGADTLVGGAGNDFLVGQDGGDSMTGGAGNDTYVVDSALDAVNEAVNQGIDWVVTSINYTLGADVENLILAPAAVFTGTGNVSNNFMLGNFSNNTLSGLDGADTLRGGLGADTLLGGNGADILIGDIDGSGISLGSGTLVKNAGAGNNSIAAALDISNLFSFAADADILNPTAVPHVSIQATTDGAVDFYKVNIANAGATIFADIDTGGFRLDSYVKIFDPLGRVVSLNDDSNITDGGGGSTFTVDSFALAVATMSGMYTIAVYGAPGLGGLPTNEAYELQVSVLGEFDAGSADTLNGGDGADAMNGGGGNDTYVVDNSGDVVTETSNSGGVDLVQSSISFTLGDNLESLTLTGAVAIDGTGNALANTLIGNGAANVLNGGLGNDVMIGGNGNDTYVVNALDDVVTESSAGGGAADLVRSSIQYTLGAFVENLTIIGTGAFTGTGNGLANILTGNNAANILEGDVGNDTLEGKGGSDFLDGGTGTDTVTYATSTAAVNANLTTSAGTGGDAAGDAYASIENLTGSAFNDTLTGRNTANVLSGGAGLDTLSGADGLDTLTGGAAADKFVFNTAATALNTDIITDFVHNVDKIQFENGVFTAIGAAGVLNANAFFAGANASDASDRILYDAATGNLFYDANGNLAGQKVLVAVLDAGLVITNTDFQVI